MKKILPIFAIVFIVAFCTYQFLNKEITKVDFLEIEEEAENRPDDWLYNQRAYPHNHIDIEAYRAGVQQIKAANQSIGTENTNQWELVGPENTGGRITDVELDPTDQDVIYIGASVGGIFKTTNSGQTWTPIFDDANSLSIGNIAMAPSNNQVLYVGTGEANGSATSGAFFGDGIYKTTDAGLTWTHKGLENSQHIGRIAVDPQNENRLYVAAAGLLYGKSNDKGVYRSLDGGDTWENVLFISDSTSIIDVAVNPQNADIVFAASWERTRFPWGRIYGGPSSGIHRSLDGGTTWTKLSGGLPVSDAETGRIGLYVAPSDPNIVYASYTTNKVTNEFEALYKSTDGGDTWFVINDDITFVNATFGWFFGNVRVAPNNPNEVYVLGQLLMNSTDGGADFDEVTGNVHVDFHALEIHPANTQRRVIGCDGGVYISDNGGDSWTHIQNLPVTQFYTCEVDETLPNRYYGGTQDNGTNRTLTGSTNDWSRIFGGDGFYVSVDPMDNDFVYVEYQWGNLFRSEDGGFDFDWALDGIDYNDRTNWNTPVVLDRTNPSTMYYGSNKLYKSVDRAISWNPISEDLTDGQHPSGTQAFGTITTIDVSLTNGDVIYVGTDDGNVQVTLDGGSSWNNISAGIPDRSVTRVAVDPVNPLIAYVTISGYRFTDYIPHVFKTINAGQTWEDISGNLPEIPVNDIIVDPNIDGTLYLANDVGVWITFDEGQIWSPLGDNLPLTVVTDLRLHNPTRTLVAATFGRSMHTYDLNQVSTSVEELAAINNLKVFPNPIQDRATIEFELTEGMEGIVQILDYNGSVVNQIENRNYSIGSNTVSWSAKDLSSGNYIVRLQTDKTIMTQKIQVVK